MGTWDWDIRTNEVVWSDNLEAIFGLDAGSFDGTFEGFLRLIHPADREDVVQAIARSIQAAVGTRGRVPHRPDGRIDRLDVGQGAGLHRRRWEARA